MPRGSEARAPQRDATATRSLSTTTRKATWPRRPSTHTRTHAYGGGCHAHSQIKIQTLRCDPRQNSNDCPAEMEKPALNFIWNLKGSQIAKTILKKKACTGGLTPQFQTALQIRSNPQCGTGGDSPPDQQGSCSTRKEQPAQQRAPGPLGTHVREDCLALGSHQTQQLTQNGSETGGTWGLSSPSRD